MDVTNVADATSDTRGQPERTAASEGPATGFIRVGTLAALVEKGAMVVKGRRCPILVVHHQGRVFALDNRCPHLGFPLHRGSVADGILTCHWHHARFDLCSGGTFDLWADDVPVGSAEVRGDDVWVSADCGHPSEAHYWRRRLQDAMAHSLGLVAAKAILALLDHKVAPADILREAVVFGCRAREDWSTGLTIATALAAMLPHLDEGDRFVALYQGVRRIAADAAGATPRRARRALDLDSADTATLKRWLRQWTLVRHRNGAERTVLTALNVAPPAQVADALFAAATDRAFADGGHTLDFINKAFECLDLIGWDNADLVLPTVVSDLVAARGEEESDSWRHPLDLVPLLNAAFERLPERLRAGAARRGAWADHARLAEDLLGDEPQAAIAALDAAIAAGATPDDLGRALAYAAALRVARFGTANEQSDWETAHHVFTYCNALHQALRRMSSDAAGAADRGADALRGVYHGAMALYLARFLNVPPTPLPGERPAALAALPSAPDDLCVALLDAMDRPEQVDAAGRLVARYLALGHPPDGLVATLGHALLREDFGFHAVQMFEAGVRQFEAWNGAPEGGHVLVALARYLAAHAPTQRSQAQTVRTARRLHRGSELYEDDEVPSA